MKFESHIFFSKQMFLYHLMEFDKAFENMNIKIALILFHASQLMKVMKTNNSDEHPILGN